MANSNSNQAEIITVSEIKKEKAKQKSKVSFALKKGDLQKIAIIVGVLVIGIPVLDAIIQFSLFQRYAAFVGNNQVTRSEYELALERSYGQTVLNDLIVEKIVLNEINTKGISVDEAKITENITTIKAQFASDTEYQTALKSESLSEEQLKSRIRLQLGLELIVKPTLVEIKDEDLKKYFDDNKESLYKDKTFEESKTAIKETIQSTELSAKTNEWVTGKLKEFSIANNLTLSENRSYKIFNSVPLVSKLLTGN